MPSQEFIGKILSVFDSKSYDSLKKLYAYVMQYFNITDFVLITKL